MLIGGRHGQNRNVMENTLKVYSFCKKSKWIAAFNEIGSCVRVKSSPTRMLYCKLG